MIRAAGEMDRNNWTISGVIWKTILSTMKRYDLHLTKWRDPTKLAQRLMTKRKRQRRLVCFTAARRHYLTAVISQVVFCLEQRCNDVLQEKPVVIVDQ